jgi:hypothetical protein
LPIDWHARLEANLKMKIDSARPPSLILVCDWIPPEFGAVGQYMHKRAYETAQEGAHAAIIGLGVADETVTQPVGKGVLTVVRIRASANPKTSMLRRALWTLSTNRRLAAAAARCQKGADDCRIVVTGSPPFLSYWLLLQNLLFWRKRVAYRMTDFYPETAMAAGTARWLALAKPLFRLLRRAASEVEVLGEDQRRRLIEDGFAPERITLLRDPSPIADWNVQRAHDRPFEQEHVVLLYSGNMGVAHDCTAFCEAYRRHVTERAGRVRLWINGRGQRVTEVAAFCEQHGLPLFISPPVSLDRLPAVLRAADAHLVLLGEAFWGYVLPSKIYACLDSGKPIMYVGPEQSDVHHLATRHDTKYWHAPSGDVESCLAALTAIAALKSAPAKTYRQDIEGYLKAAPPQVSPVAAAREHLPAPSPAPRAR